MIRSRCCAALGTLGINDLLVEGGTQVHAAFLKAGAYDRLELYLGLKTLAGGLPVAAGEGVATPSLALGWELEEPVRMLGATCLMRLHHPGPSSARAS